MAALTISKLSHKQYHARLKKERRKWKRRAIAQERQKDNDFEGGNVSDGSSESNDETEREKQHLLWLQREEVAQEEFRRQQELQEKRRKDREEQLRQMKEEIDNLTLKKQHKEATLLEVKSKLSEGVNGPWHNPIAPTNGRGETSEQEICQFFVKTGACRFGERCSRNHVRPSSSCILMIKGMFSHFSMEQAMTDDYDADAALEYEDSETYQYFQEFYEDVLPEFRRCGRVVQLKVCCNHEPHLRGNVYVQFETEEEAQNAFKVFNGRYYGGKQLSCEFASISSWKSAICGLFHRNVCPKGKNCNFLHVFKNPSNEFWHADRDMIPRRFDGSRHGRRLSSPYNRDRGRRRCRSPSDYERSSRSHRKSKKKKKKHKHSSKKSSRNRSPSSESK